MIGPPNSNFAETFHRRQLNKIVVRDLKDLDLHFPIFFSYYVMNDRKSDFFNCFIFCSIQ